MLQQLEQRGCTLIDTTCGSVLNVWKNVRRYAEGGYTSVIHGKVWHEETQATASHAVTYGGRYLVVLDDRETAMVCDYIRGRGDREAFLARFGGAVSAGFDPDRDLCRIGLANQTTMLMSESLAIGEMLKAADPRALRARPRSPTTSRRSTRSAAPRRTARTPSSRCWRETPPDLMIVIGGYNSSNTCNLARICAERCPTFHIADPDCLVSAETIRHRPVGAKDGSADVRLAAAGGARNGGTDVRRVHAGQPGRRRRRKTGRILRLALGCQALGRRLAVSGHSQPAEPESTIASTSHAPKISRTAGPTQPECQQKPGVFPSSSAKIFPLSDCPARLPVKPVPGESCEKSAADKHNRQAHRIPFKNSYFRGLRMMLSRICQLTAAAVLLSLMAVPVAESSQQTTPRGWWRTNRSSRTSV